MKRKLKIQFTDFWSGFRKEDNLFFNLLRNKYDLEISNSPEILIYSVYNFEHLNYRCSKIFYTAENVRPDFSECDFAVSFDYEDAGGKIFRMPNYRWRGDLKRLCDAKEPQKIADGKSKFCCTVVSNGNGKERNSFFELLSNYKQVDSGGKYMNNVGGAVKDKMAFIRDYKFVFAFENSSFPGYTTEKIVEPMLENCIPIYWGNPQIGRDFNTKCFINVHDYSTFEKVVEEIIRIDTNDDLFHSYLNESFFKYNQFPESLEFEFIENKLSDVIECLLRQDSVSQRFFYKPTAWMRKYKKKLLSRMHGRPHFYY